MTALDSPDATSQGETLIFLDVDGVLNVGLQADDGGAPLLLSDGNVRLAFDDSACRGNGAKILMSMKVWSAAARLYDAVCADEGHLSAVLVDRLAEIIEAAGERCSVVLSSHWRKPRHSDFVDALESEIAGRLGGYFAFAGRTELVEDNRPEDRLHIIAGHVKQHCASQGVQSLTVLILDDLFATPLRGWSCDGRRVRGAADCEAFVRRFAASKDLRLRVKLLHCYDEWETQDGIQVQAGAGLSAAGVEEARAFLKGDDSPAEGLLALPAKWGSMIYGSRRLRRWARCYGA